MSIDIKLKKEKSGNVRQITTSASPCAKSVLVSVQLLIGVKKKSRLTDTVTTVRPHRTAEAIHIYAFQIAGTTCLSFRFCDVQETCQAARDVVWLEDRVFDAWGIGVGTLCRDGAGEGGEGDEEDGEVLHRSRKRVDGQHRDTCCWGCRRQSKAQGGFYPRSMLFIR